MTFVIVDVGCIECGEQTEVVGIYATEEAAKSAFEEYAGACGVTEWSPRGGFLEMLAAPRNTYVGGTGYFSGGQHAIELHRLTNDEASA